MRAHRSFVQRGFRNRALGASHQLRVVSGHIRSKLGVELVLLNVEVFTTGQFNGWRECWSECAG